MRRAVLMATCLVGLLAMPAVAHAGPNWGADYKNPAVSKFLEPGVPMNITTSGSLAFAITVTEKGIAQHYKVKCKLADAETIENPLSGGPGIDEILRFELVECFSRKSPCTDVQMSPPGPVHWPTMLVAGPPIRDEIQGVELAFSCNGAVLFTLTGTLFPEVQLGKLVFNSSAGTLSAPGATSTVNGTDKLKGPKGILNIWAA